MGKGNPGEARNLDSAIATVQRVDNAVALLGLAASETKGEADGVGDSAQVFYDCLVGVDIDGDTKAAVRDVRTHIKALAGEAGGVIGDAKAAGGLAESALKSLGGHRNLSDKVKGHKHAARMGFYK